jgi:hypothetical protein
MSLQYRQSDFTCFYVRKVGDLRSRFAVIKTEPLYTVCYYKIAGRWYLDAPEYLETGGNPDALERIGSFHDLLETASEGESSVVFQMDTQPFEGADVAELVGSSGGDTGGYYRIHQLLGKIMDIEIWFNTLIYYDNAVLPQTIYFKRIFPI